MMHLWFYVGLIDVYRVCEEGFSVFVVVLVLGFSRFMDIPTFFNFVNSFVCEHNVVLYL